MRIPREHVTSFVAVSIPIFWESAANEAGRTESPVQRVLPEGRQRNLSFYVTRVECLNPIGREC